MPTPVVKTMSKEAGVSVNTGEKRWQEAKQKTPPEVDDKWAYTMGIFKRMMGQHESTKLVGSYNDFIQESIDEGYISELDIIRQESSSLQDFIKNAKAEFPKIANMKDADEFLEEIWNISSLDESVNKVSLKNTKYIKTFENFISEDYARVHPNPGMNVGGMGPIVIPEVGVYNSTGSGDMPAPYSTSDRKLKKQMKKGAMPVSRMSNKDERKKD